MNRKLMIALTLSLAFLIAGPAQSAMQTPGTAASMSPREAKLLMKTAHSSADYQKLAAYFHQQEAQYRAQAADEKIEVARRSQVNAALYQKYPRPVDTAQALYESYVTDADNAALQARHYDQLAADTQGKS